MASASRSGSLTVEVMHTPGHTPADIAYRIGEDVFVGDTLFMHDYGTARAISPAAMRAAVSLDPRLLALPPQTRLWMCHDYKAPGRDDFAWQIHGGRAARAQPACEGRRDGGGVRRLPHARDATLAAPLLLLPSIQVNIRAGRFPPAESNGVRYLRCR
jgi:glyoxylase-like metal-dependent hydrolase (beta-lactamase superfamily II)